MRHIWSIASKELRGYFHSPVALIFLATFLGVVLFTFFWVDTFFSRGLADVRPMFEWLPLLLIFLVSALTMRLWSEEQKLGTIEVLMTLPVPIHRLVLGKFVAGLLLVALALAMTIGLPITVSMMGSLDWGPVIGGYLGALLLAAAYLSIGLCVSSVTDNQIVALIFTTAACVLFYLPGADAVVGFFDHETAAVLRDLGTGSRFDSIARGVVDLRDLAYYGALVAFFLALNTAILHAKRWSTGSRTRGMRQGTKVAVALVLANVLAFNLWLNPIGSARIDLTENKRFTLAPVTAELVRRTEEPLLIRGYFTSETHPYLAPLVPQIRDVLREYDVVGGSNLRVEFVDPTEDEALANEARDDYGIESLPFSFEARHESKVVNAYFHILIQYGDQFEVLSFDDLVDVQASGPGDVDVQVSNLEYNITRSIRKAVFGFQSIENLLASLESDAKLSFYVTPGSLPEGVASVPETVEKVASELSRKGGDTFTYEKIVPQTEAQRRELLEEYGFQPFTASLFGDDTFYLHLVLEIGDKVAQVPLRQATNEGEIRSAITEGLKRAAPGFLRTVGLVVPPAEAPPRDPHSRQPQQQPRPPQNFSQLQQMLGQEYEVQKVDPEANEIPAEIDTLVLAGPEELSEDAVRRVDQFLMRGGGLIVLAGRYRLDLEAPNLALKPVSTGLEEALKSYGVEVPQTLVLDDHNEKFPVPIMDGRQVRNIRLVPYPFFVRARQSQLDGSSPVVAGLQGGLFHWSSPVKTDAPEGVEVTELATSSDSSWLQASADIRPDFTRHRETGFARPDDLEADQTGPFALATTLTGRFDSYFASSEDEGSGEADSGDDAEPGESAGGESDDDAEPGESADGEADEAADGAADAGAADEPASADEADEDAEEAGQRLLARSVSDARIAVVGSSSFVSDELARLSQQTRSKLISESFQLVQNLVDWSVTDTELLAIRSSGGATRVLEVPEDERQKWELINYAIVVFLLLIVVGATTLNRRTLTPMPLTPPAKREGARTSETSEEEA